MLTRLFCFMSTVAVTALISAGCGTGPLGECPPNSKNQQDLGSFVLYTTCTGCHSSSLTGEEREGAPAGSDYDNPELVRPQSEEIYEWVQSGTMPPDGGLNAEQMEAVRVYLACGAP